MEPWRNFAGNVWRNRIDVTEFVRDNYQPYYGSARFLQGASEKTQRLWEKCLQLMEEERAAGGVLAIDTRRVAGITAWPPGYIDQVDEVIVGIQTDQPLKRMVNPWGGWRMVEAACAARNVKPDSNMAKIFTRYRRTQNEAIFRIYTPAMRQARKIGIITGLPDAYGRGRLIGDYRRVALYGTDFLMEEKRKDLYALDNVDDTTIHLREDIADQVRALERMAELGRHTAATSPGRHITPGRRYNGFIWPIYALSRNKTALPCPSAIPARSLTFISNATCKRGRLMKRRPRNSWTSW